MKFRILRGSYALREGKRITMYNAGDSIDLTEGQARAFGLANLKAHGGAGAAPQKAPKTPAEAPAPELPVEPVDAAKALLKLAPEVRAADFVRFANDSGLLPQEVGTKKAAVDGLTKMVEDADAG
jgi:hypothetical protein